MRISFSDGLAVFGIVATVVLVALDKAGKLRGPLPIVLLGVAALMTLPLAIGNDWVMDSNGLLRFGRGMVMMFIVGLIFSSLIVWIAQDSVVEPESTSGKPNIAIPSRQAPSFVFVFGAPLGDNDSPVWIMMLKHYGPQTAFNCTVEFFDRDRKNIEHIWMVEHHPNPSFLPPSGIVGQSQQLFHIPEAGPLGAIGSFQWSPLDPNNQHYTVSITCREGVFVETWEVARVNGSLRSKLIIERGPQWIKANPTLEPGVFRCIDPEFVDSPLLSVAPVKSAKPFNPGWKPNHRFEIPVAILDPNGHVQVLSGVKQPDGS